MVYFNTKKLKIKKTFLQKSLSQFLFWRETEFQNSVLKQSQKTSINFADSSILIRYLWFSKFKYQQNLKTNKFEKTKNLNSNWLILEKKFLNEKHIQIYNDSNRNWANESMLKKIQKKILSQFFPHRKTFIYYWLFPFVGFIGLTFFQQNSNGQFYFNSKLFNHQFSTDNDLAISKKVYADQFIKKDFASLKSQELNSYAQGLAQLDMSEISDLWNLYFSKTRKLIYSWDLTNPKNNENYTLRNPHTSNLSYAFMESLLANNLLKRSSNYWHWYTLDSIKISDIAVNSNAIIKPKKIFVNTLNQFGLNTQNVKTPFSLKKSFFPMFIKKEMDLEPITSYQKGTFILENIVKDFFFKGNLEKKSLTNSLFSVNSLNFGVRQELPLQKGKIYSSMLRHLSCLGADVNSFNQETGNFEKFNNLDVFNNKKLHILKTEEKITNPLSLHILLKTSQKDLKKMFFKKMRIQQVDKNFVSKCFCFYKKKHFNNLINQNKLLNPSLTVKKLFNLKLKIFSAQKKFLISKNNLNYKKEILNYTSSQVNANSTKGIDFLFALNNQKYSLCELIVLRQLKEKSKNLTFHRFHFPNQNVLGNGYVTKNKNQLNNNFTPKDLQQKQISKLLNKISLKVFERVIQQNGEKIHINKKVEKIYILKYPFLMADTHVVNTSRLNDTNQNDLKSTLFLNLANQPLNLQKIVDYRTILTNKLLTLQKSFGANFVAPDLNKSGNSFLFKKSVNHLTPYEQNKNVSPMVSSFTFSSDKPEIKEEFSVSKIMFNLNTNFSKQLNILKEKLSLILNKQQVKLLDQHQINDSLNLFVFKQSNFLNENVEQSIQNSLKKQNSNSFVVGDSVVINQIFQKNKKLFSLKKEKTRKSEKIFRTYLSCKSTKNSLKKLPLKKNYQLSPYVMSTLKKVKLHLKEKTSVTNLKMYTHSSPYGLIDSSTLNKSYLNFKKRLNSNSLNLKLNVNKKPSQLDTNHPRRLSPNGLLTKLGFIFLDNTNLSLKNENFIESQSLISISPTFVNKLKIESLNRVEKLKSTQKKRRKKKLKLENRRRKKRKRYFPRPKWLRFNLYSRFLKIRHYKTSANKKLNSKNAKSISSFNLIFPEKTLNFPLKHLNPYKWKKVDSSSSYFQKTSNLKTSVFKLDKEKLDGKIYRQNKQYWGGSGSLFDGNSLEKENRKKLPLMWNIPLFENNQFYQISNSVMSDFQRLCWKSYWLRSNLTPYIQRVQSSLKEIQKSEKSENSVNNLNLYLNYLFGTDKSIWFKADQKYFSLTNRKDSSLMWYLNVKNSNEHVQSLSDVSLLQNSQNVAEYNRILYDRMSDVIKNVKSNLTVNGQSHARTYKRGRFKTESRTFISSTSPNGDTKEQLISNDFFSRLGRQFNPQISAFSIFASSMDSSIKPYGELPTLRVLWALNKTNMLSFQSKNEVKTLWSMIKTREQNKSNKTKRFLSKSWKTIIFKLSSLSEYSTNSTQDSLIETDLNSKENMLNKQTIKQKQNLTKSCFKKVNFTDKKLQFFGVSNKNYGDYLRQLKISLKSKFDKQVNPILSQMDSTKLVDNDIFSKNYINSNKVLKNSSTFWWSTLQSNKAMETIVLAEKNTALHSIFSNTKSTFFTKNFSSNGLSIYLLENSFCVCLVLFNLCILFSFLRISEVRSLVKFNLLISYKIFNSYLVVLYYVFNLLKTNKNQILKIYKTSFKTKIFRKKVKSLNLVETDSSEKMYNHNPNLFLKSYISIWENFWNEHFKIKAVQNFNVKSFPNYSANIFEITLRSPHISNSLGQTFNNVLESNESMEKSNFPFKSTYFGKWSSRTEKTNKEKQFLKVGVPQNMIMLTNQEQSFLTSRNSDSLTFQILNEQKNFKKLINTNLVYQIFKSIVLKNRALNFITLTNTKIKSFISLVVLYVLKFYINLIYQSINICYAILFKIISFLESIMLIIYKFLEKPAELMVEWIAQIFLVEWSSDVTSYVPASTDIYLWNSFKKFWRTNRFFGFIGFLIERRFWCFFHVFIQELIKPDSDIIVRQKKGIIFWDIWAEILIKAAEQYNINIPSLTTLREEQEVLIEKLLDDQNWEWCQSSMHQLTPLINSVHTTRPNLLSNIQLNPSHVSEINYLKLKNSFVYPNLWTKFQKHSDKFIKKEEVGTLTNGSAIWRRWSVNQYFTLQGVDTDLFVDLHLPKSFCHMTTLKYYEPIQPTLGSLVCQIYSGLLKKQVSKNLLVVGAPGTGKSLLIQALAGETEAKLISDNAHRYAYVQRGVAVGMKLLRDVFDAIALHTPCLFLMEDIHLIGERRPMLISDDENAKAADQSFVGENEEVHEKNQIIYQLNRHSIAHYKKPYKGDFSLLIPTNHFCFSLFLGVSPARVRKLGISPKSPLPISTIENQLESNEKTETGNSQSQFDSSFSNAQQEADNTLTSRLQFISEKLFAPPATSPFTILVMKEQKKLKPRKLVAEMPWGGLSWDQMMLVPKVTYSIRVKVALLADIAISHLSVKLDMITDLLVIMDSVRSNRGFIVFATTHIPYVLDPALRRPGRLDETISLPLFPNFLNRLEILKTNFISFSSTLDFVDYSNVLANLNETEISSFISKTKLLLLNNNSFKQEPSFRATNNTFNYLNENNFSKVNKNNVQLTKKMNETYKNKEIQRKLKLQYTIQNSYLTVEKNYKKKFPVNSIEKAIKLKLNSETEKASIIRKYKEKSFKNINRIKTRLSKVKNKSLLNLLRNFSFYPSIPTGSSNLISLTYFQISKFLLNSQFDGKNYSNFVLFSKFQGFMNKEESLFRELYSSPFDFQNNLMLLLAGKVGEFLIFNNYSICRYSILETKLKEQGLCVPSTSVHWSKSLQTYNQTGLWSLAGVDSFWQSATSLVFSLIQKRFLYNQNLLVSRMLYFDNLSTLKEPPSPPGSSILMPAKKYENFQRTSRDFQEKSIFSINEKIQMHQQQRLIKKLYNKPIKEYFNSEMIKNRLTSFNTSFKELGYLDSFLKRPSSTNAYYTNRILKRNKFSLVNQWWNGQLEEHNVETTFLSDVDWRSMFLSSLGDLTIDFPDADQHYNPRQRRWFLQSSYSNYWYTFEKTIPYEIYSHFMKRAFHKVYNFLDSEREILDYLAFLYLKKGVLKEIDLITIKSRFYLLKQNQLIQ